MAILHAISPHPLALVLGLGASGLAMARWLSCQGYAVRVLDTRAAPPQLPALRAALPQVEFQTGAFDAQALSAEVSLVCTSPGISPASSAGLRQAAAERGVPVLGELELFARGLRELDTLYAYRPKVLAITGTNGKTTVASLTGLLVQRAGLRVEIAGNIGPCLLDRLRACMLGYCLPEVWVLELSSFQLHDAHSFAPSAAVVLNITQDHLDWHGDMQEYIADKLKVFAPSTTAIINRDEGEFAFTSRIANKNKISYGLNLPQGHLDFGLDEGAGDIAWLVQSVSALGGAVPKKNQDLEISLNRLMPSESLRIQGRHNLSNALAALALITAIDLPLGAPLRALADYAGEPHRLQPVAQKQDVTYVDDSKGTNVGASVAAMNSLGCGLQAGQKLLLIMGGDGKGQDFAPLTQPLAQYARAAVLIGKDADAIAAFVPETVATQRAASMQEAVQICAQAAQAGDTVLLSPACASLDMYRDYAHRAEMFCAAVAQVAAEGGKHE